MPFVPSFPASTSLYRYLGLDASLVGPPLPKGPTEELVGTEYWAKAVPSMYSRRTHVGWFDMRQVDEEGKSIGEYENFWPGMSRWVLGARMDDAVLEFSAAEQWGAAAQEM